MKWAESDSPRRHIAFIKVISRALCKKGGALSAEFNQLVQSERFRDLVDREIDYERGYPFEDYLYARQIKALVEKQDVLDLGYDRRKAAEKAFIDAEKKCQETNLRLSLPCPEKDVAAVFHYAQRKIAEVLGDVPSFGEMDFFFGPGATTNVKGSRSNANAKLSARLSCSKDMLPIVAEFLSELPHLCKDHSIESSYELEFSTELGLVSSNELEIVPVDIHTGKLTFVPKNSKTDRPICVEPVLNSLLQKGYGTYLKNRLRRFGVDLFDQTRNQSLAGYGSVTGKLATIDLKSASDCMAIGLVLSLLPFQWAEALSFCRTGDVEYEGFRMELEKFSSMGNGFTFELESLIFFGLMSGVKAFLLQTGEISSTEYAPIGVYGDDLIIPTCGYNLAVRVLEYAGFSVNTAKSFCTGPFRESCGADFFIGKDLRPFYLRKGICGQVLFSFHNWAIRNCEPSLARLVLGWIPRCRRLWGPNGYGDGHLIGSYILKVPRWAKRRGWEGGFFYSYVSSPVRVKARLSPSFPLYATYSGMTVEGPAEPDIVRGSAGVRRQALYTLKPSVY